MGNIFQYYNTYLPLWKEIGYNIDKSMSPFNMDSGYDYDYRGYYNKYNTLNPYASNGHLTDEFKKPNHPTFSIESRYYSGQPYAVDWDKDPYKTLSAMGIL